MSATRDGRGRGTGTFIDLYSLLRFALRPFDDPTTVEESLALSEYRSDDDDDDDDHDHDV